MDLTEVFVMSLLRVVPTVCMLEHHCVAVPRQTARALHPLPPQSVARSRVNLLEELHAVPTPARSEISETDRPGRDSGGVGRGAVRWRGRTVCASRICRRRPV